MIRRWLQNINKQYDNIDDPNRLFVLIAITMPGIILSNADTMLPAFAGMGYLIILTVVRYLYIAGKYK